MAEKEGFFVRFQGLPLCSARSRLFAHSPVALETVPRTVSLRPSNPLRTKQKSRTSYDFFVLAEKVRCPQFPTHILSIIHYSQGIFRLAENIWRVTYLAALLLMALAIIVEHIPWRSHPKTDTEAKLNNQ